MIPRSPETFGLRKSDKGLEIAPWFNPLVPKSKGYNVKTADVFTAQELMESAKGNDSIDPDTYGQIEEVDFVGSATELASIVPKDEHGTYDYIFSSHNFEHLPNPIKFLNACETLLKPGGRVVMVLPDGRRCFDYFRLPTFVSEWLDAYKEDRQKPTAKQVFDSLYVMSREAVGSDFTSVSHVTPASKHRLQVDPAQLWEDWREATPDAPYRDAHCSVMTPSSLRLMIEDCRYLGLTSLACVEVQEPKGIEFLVVLEKPVEAKTALSAEEYSAMRLDLLHRVWKEQSWRETRCEDGAFLGAKGQPQKSGLLKKLKAMNRKRLQRRRRNPG